MWMTGKSISNWSWFCELLICFTRIPVTWISYSLFRLNKGCQSCFKNVSNILFLPRQSPSEVFVYRNTFSVEFKYRMLRYPWEYSLKYQCSLKFEWGLPGAGNIWDSMSWTGWGTSFILVYIYLCGFEPGQIYLTAAHSLSNMIIVSCWKGRILSA